MTSREGTDSKTPPTTPVTTHTHTHTRDKKLWVLQKAGGDEACALKRD